MSAITARAAKAAAAELMVEVAMTDKGFKLVEILREKLGFAGIS